MRLSSDIGRLHPAVLILRFTTAGLMLFHGIGKLMHGVGPISGLLDKVGMPAWFSYGVLVGELVAPLLVIAGVWVRIAALVMAINMVVAVALAHPSELFTVGESGGYALELQAFFFFCSLVIAWLANGRTARIG